MSGCKPGPSFVSPLFPDHRSPCSNDGSTCTPSKKDEIFGFNFFQNNLASLSSPYCENITDEDQNNSKWNLKHVWYQIKVFRLEKCPLNIIL